MCDWRSEWIGLREGEGGVITGTFGLQRENDNGRRVVDFCAERGLCADHTYLKHKSLTKY